MITHTTLTGHRIRTRENVVDIQWHIERRKQRRCALLIACRMQGYYIDFTHSHLGDFETYATKKATNPRLHPIGQ